MKMMAKVIYFDGLSGAGKTTQINWLLQFLESENKTYRLVREKEFQPFAKQLMQWKNSSENSLRAFDSVRQLARARGEMHAKHLIPLLARCDFVIFDRCVYTSAIYHSYYDHQLQDILKVNYENGIIRPTIGILFLCSVDTALNRIRLRNRPIVSLPLSFTEITSFLNFSHRQYSELLKYDSSICRIDTEFSKHQIFNTIKPLLDL